MILFYESYFNDSDQKKVFFNNNKRAKIQVQVIHCNQHSCIKGTNMKNTQKQAIWGTYIDA